MARVKYSSLVSEISGSIGSATFQKSLYGNTLRSKPMPRFSSSPAQQLQRAVMLRLHREWAALDPAQRDVWNKFISYSSGTINRDASVLLTGHALYIKYNALRACNGWASISDPVYTPMAPVLAFVRIKITAGDLYFEISDSQDPTVIAFALKLSAPRSPSLSFTWKGLRTIELDSAGDSQWLIDITYRDIFGQVPVVGSTLHVSMQWFSYLSPIVMMPRTFVTTVVAV